jgi:succinoglycan biosynthesis protein ExoM
MSNASQHITLCICTYKRPELLRRLFDGIGAQETSGLFTFSIVVVDNDHSESAKRVVEEFIAASPIPAIYCVEPRQSIALARNKAIENAKGDFVAFIDDDEFPTDRWLLTLFEACCQYNVDGVLGPVKPHFDEEPPRWVVKGKFYERETYPTGFVIDWRKGRTGNVILRRRVFAGWAQPFNPEFWTGEDQHFFLDAIEKGHVFIWCNEAVAYEVVPPIRWKRMFMLRRALLRGSMEPKGPTFGLRSVAKSLLAVPLYVLALPFALMAGQDKFMGLLVRLCDHLGKLLAIVGINLIKEQYVTE